MKKLLLIVLGLGVVLVAAVLVIPSVIPTETYKRQITAQVEKATGRQLTIQGPLRFSLLPAVALKAEDVRFANAEGSAEPDMARLKGLEIELEVWPLLRGSVEVARFVLVEPVIHLEVGKDGRPNWQLGETVAEPAGPSGPDAGGGDAPAGSPNLPVTEVKLGDIRIERGTLTYTDLASGASERVEAINLTLDLPDLRSRLQATGSVDYKGQAIKLNLALASPLEVVQGGSSPIRLTVDSAPARIAFEGLVSNGAEPSAAGGLDLNVPSIRTLAAWLAEPIAFAGEGLETLTIKGNLNGTAKRVAFTDAAIGLDRIAGQGELVADLGGPVPRLSGRLDLGTVDLNPYLPPEPIAADAPATAGRPQAAGGQATSDAGAPPAGAPPAPADQQPAPTAAASDWSDEPLALPPLGGAEVAFELTLDALRVRALELGRTVLGLTLQGNTLEAALREFALYDGRGSGTLRVEVEDGVPAISQRFQLEGLQALPFLTAAAEFDRLEGTASADLALTTRGGSQRQLVQNLSGTGRVALTDGAVVGINIAAMVRNAAGAFLNPDANQAQKTDFAELGGTFKIEKGVLTNDDMRLLAPVLRVNGSGRVNLPKRTVNYRLEPKAAKTLQGQGGEQEVAGLLVPVIIRGPFDDLTYTPDLSGVLESALKDPGAVKEQLEQLGGQAKDLKRVLKDAKRTGGTDALVEGLTGALGGSQKKAPAGEADETEGEAKPEEQVQKLLKGLLGN